MTTNYTYWRDDEDSSTAMIPNLSALEHALVLGKGKAMPVMSVDGNVVFLSVDKDKDEDLFDKKLGLVLQGNALNAAGALCQPAKRLMVSHHAKLEGHYILGSSHLKNCYVSYSFDAEDEARRQILEAVSRKGVTAVAPTTSVGLPAPTTELYAPGVEIQSLLSRIKFLEGQLRSNLPYLQMYKFGAGSLLVAIISLVVWVFTGAGAPFHPIFAVMVIPVAIGLMIMAFLVRRDIPNPPRRQE